MPITALFQTSLSRISPLVASPTTMARNWSLPPAAKFDWTSSLGLYQMSRASGLARARTSRRLSGELHLPKTAR
jgi:hypothetical protein